MTMKTFQVLATIEFGFWLNIEAEDSKTAQAIMLERIRKETIPPDASPIHRGHHVRDIVVIKATETSALETVSYRGEKQ